MAFEWRYSSWVDNTAPRTQSLLNESLSARQERPSLWVIGRENPRMPPFPQHKKIVIAFVCPPL